jgi:hypothetical protein
VLQAIRTLQEAEEEIENFFTKIKRKELLSVLLSFIG